MSNFIPPGSGLPSGAIVPFHGDPSDIPTGWNICDGNNGTPDLRDKFVRSVPDGQTDPGAIGGEASKTLSESQVPSHKHSGTADAAGEHEHYAPGDNHTELEGSEWADHDPDEIFAESSVNGTHSHSFTTDQAGSDDAYNNQPAYVELIFIQKA